MMEWTPKEIYYAILFLAITHLIAHFITVGRETYRIIWNALKKHKDLKGETWAIITYELLLPYISLSFFMIAFYAAIYLLFTAGFDNPLILLIFLVAIPLIFLMQRYYDKIWRKISIKTQVMLNIRYRRF